MRRSHWPKQKEQEAAEESKGKVGWSQPLRALPAVEWLQGVPLRSRRTAGGLICQWARLTSVKHTLLVRHLRRETGPC